MTAKQKLFEAIEEVTDSSLDPLCVGDKIQTKMEDFESEIRASAFQEMTDLSLYKRGRKEMLKDVEKGLDKIDSEWDTDNSTVISAIRSYRHDVENLLSQLHNPTKSSGTSCNIGITTLNGQSSRGCESPGEQKGHIQKILEIIKKTYPIRVSSINDYRAWLIVKIQSLSQLHNSPEDNDGSPKESYCYMKPLDTNNPQTKTCIAVTTSEKGDDHSNFISALKNKPVDSQGEQDGKVDPQRATQSPASRWEKEKQ